MPRKPPSYRLHKGTGQGYTEYQRVSYYFGVYGTPESHERYARFLAQLNANQGAVAPAALPSGTVALVVELLTAFMVHAATRYTKHGTATTELSGYRNALAPVFRLHSADVVTGFGPLALDAIRQEWVAKGLARKTINQYVGRIIRVWKWGVGRQIVPVAAWQALTALESLRPGQGVSYPKVLQVPESLVDPIQPFVSRQVWAMIQYQLWTGCRPHEACQVRMSDIDRTHEIWEHRPRRFKTEHHEDSERVVYLGPHAQRLVLEWERANPDELLWQPCEARQVGRKTHRPPGSKSKRPPVRQYTSSAYCRAVEQGCERAFGMPHKLKRTTKRQPGDDVAALKAEAAAWRREHVWSPNQLRHTAATRIRKEYGIEMARLILGHTSVSTTAIYAEEDKEQVRRVVRDSG